MYTVFSFVAVLLTPVDVVKHSQFIVANKHNMHVFGWWMCENVTLVENVQIYCISKNKKGKIMVLFCLYEPITYKVIGLA